MPLQATMQSAFTPFQMTTGFPPNHSVQMIRTFQQRRYLSFAHIEVYSSDCTSSEIESTIQPKPKLAVMIPSFKGKGKDDDSDNSSFHSVTPDYTPVSPRDEEFYNAYRKL